MTFVIDIDDTLLKTSGPPNYKNLKPLKEIRFVNKMFLEGHTIILHTGRNWDKYDLTINQLEKLCVDYDELVMGKPQGIYIDKDSYKSINDYIKEKIK